MSSAWRQGGDTGDGGRGSGGCGLLGHVAGDGEAAAKNSPGEIYRVVVVEEHVCVDV